MILFECSLVKLKLFLLLILFGYLKIPISIGTSIIQPHENVVENVPIENTKWTFNKI